MYHAAPRDPRSGRESPTSVDAKGGVKYKDPFDSDKGFKFVDGIGRWQWGCRPLLGGKGDRAEGNSDFGHLRWDRADEWVGED